ncbi:MAG: sortase [Clostridia bacterium]|nr:sortase [Clostridia bacterium]
MNQILVTKILKKSKQFLIIFYISILSIFIFLGVYISYYITKKNEEKISNNFNKNYDIYRLYASSNITSTIQKDSDILGNIIIPKININYPFFAGINDELLKISPCRFYGDMPNSKSNLCIAGHNYNDNRFFSKISLLENNDLIIIEDANKNKFNYYLYNKFEVDVDNASFIKAPPINNSELTLLTCNNVNNKRIVVKAIANWDSTQKEVYK